MREWLLNKYAASTFNTCPPRPPHCMAGPPIEIHMDPLTKPIACHTPSPIPLHWQQKVHDDLIRDEAMGILEKVPHGEPTECAIAWSLSENMIDPLAVQWICRR